jgi:hypothetical protein
VSIEAVTSKMTESNKWRITMQLHLLAVLAAIAITGCSTSLQSSRHYADSSIEPGVLYNLPMTVIDVDAKFLVTGCEKKGGVHVLTWELADSTVVHSLAPDPAETYRIPYQALNSPLKFTNATFTMHPNGMIKSINAEVDDRTTQVLASVAGTALNLFKASLLSVSPTSLEASTAACEEFIASKIMRRKSILETELPAARIADKALVGDRKEADEFKVAVEQFKARLAESQKGTDTAATAMLKVELAKAQAQASFADAKLKDRKLASVELQATLTTLTEALTFSVTNSNWRPRSDSRCVEVTAPHADFLARLARASNAKVPNAPEGENFSAKACVEAAGYPQTPVKSGGAGAQAESAQNASFAFTGVVYRQPVTGTVSVKDVRSGGARFTSPTGVSMPQFGAKALVWLENKTFDKNSVVVSFNEDGSMSSLAFKAEARAERGAAAAQDLSKSVVELMKLRSDAIKAKAQAADEEQKKVQQAQLDTLDQQIALIDKRKDLETARAPNDPLDKEKDQLKKRIEVEKLRQELDAIKKKAE